MTTRGNVTYVARRRIDENQPEGISPGTSAPDPAPSTQYGAVTTVRGKAGCSEASVIQTQGSLSVSANVA